MLILSENKFGCLSSNMFAWSLGHMLASGDGDSVKDKENKLCLDCDHRCEDIKDCNFRPRRELISKNKNHVHPEDPRYLKKQKNTEMCVVCKDMVKMYKWVKLKFGYYPLCLDCHKRHLQVAKMYLFM